MKILIKGVGFFDRRLLRKYLMIKQTFCSGITFSENKRLLRSDFTVTGSNGVQVRRMKNAIEYTFNIKITGEQQ